MSPHKGHFPQVLKLKKMLWLAPTLAVSTAAALLVFSIAHPAQGQTTSTSTLQAISQFNQAMMSLMPELTIDPTTDPPGNFTNVIPRDFDPGKTNLVQATWLSGIGCPTNAFTFDGSTTMPLPPDSACAMSSDFNDQRNQGLLLVKTGPTSNFAAATAELINVKGITLTELGYDIRKSGLNSSSPLGSHCGAGAPRFDVITTDGVDHFVGCNSPVSVMQTPSLTGWIRLRWGAADLAAAFPPISPANVISRIVIVFDEGQDASGGPDQFGAAILDNIDVNGTLVGRGPVNAN